MMKLVFHFRTRTPWGPCSFIISLQQAGLVLQDRLLPTAGTQQGHTTGTASVLFTETPPAASHGLACSGTELFGRLMNFGVGSA